MSTEDRLDKIEEDIKLIVGAIKLIEGKQEDLPKAVHQWLCPSCHTRLGVFNPDTNEIRIKMRDQYVTMRSGPGGWVEAICRKCGHRARITDEG